MTYLYVITYSVNAEEHVWRTFLFDAKEMPRIQSHVASGRVFGKYVTAREIRKAVSKETGVRSERVYYAGKVA